MKKLLITLTVLAATVLGLLSAFPAQARVSPTPYAPPNYETWIDNGAYAVRSDDFGGSTWLRANNGPGYTIVRSTVNRSWTAFPNVFRGWQWGIGTTGGWPVQVRYDRTPRATLVTHQTWRGRYNTALDLWFATYPDRTRQANGTEIMVWLNHPGISISSSSWIARNVRINGTTWNVMAWRHTGPVSWNFIAFVRVHQVSSMYGAWLNPFFRYAEARGKLRPWWYWCTAEAGNELSYGGTNLGVVKYTVGSL